MSVARPLRQRLLQAADLLAAGVLAGAQPALAFAARARERGPWSRRVLDRAGLAVLRHHYYEPTVTAGDLRRDLGNPRPLPGLDLQLDRQLELVRSLDYGEELRCIPWAKPGVTMFGFDNPSYGVGDAEILYGMIRRHRPRRLIEIGSGQSTLIARLAIEANGSPTEHICIEPYEQPWLESLGIRIERCRVEELGAQWFDRMQAGDILFIDSSHIIRPQGDVLFELHEVIPRLAPGVLVHVHDIFTPRDYPASWVLEKRWLWNEQYLLESFLAFNGAFEVVLALNHLWHDHPTSLRSACPWLVERGGSPGAFWLRRRPA